MRTVEEIYLGVVSGEYSKNYKWLEYDLQQLKESQMTSTTKSYQLIPNEPYFGTIQEVNLFSSLGEIYEVFANECLHHGMVPATIYLTDQDGDSFEIELFDIFTTEELAAVQEIVDSETLPYEMVQGILEYLQGNMTEKELGRVLEL